MRLSGPGQALAGALLASLASSASAQQLDPRPVLIFEGHVTEEFSGAPIAGAQIDHAFPPSTAVTDSDGWWLGQRRRKLPELLERELQPVAWA